jgi:hypothetical protein
MIELVDGLGQLGEALKRNMAKVRILEGIPKDKVYIYHTWNIEDQSLEIQRNELLKFDDFVHSCHDGKIVFISTLHEREGKYLLYKMRAETTLQMFKNDFKIYRIPYMVGKGLCHKIVHDKYEPSPGEIEISTPDDIAYRILSTLEDGKKFECLHGDWLDVNTLKEALLYDRD